MKIVYWNVQGLRRKAKEISNYLEHYDIIALTETWIEENNYQAVLGDFGQGHAAAKAFHVFVAACARLATPGGHHGFDAGNGCRRSARPAPG